MWALLLSKIILVPALIFGGPVANPSFEAFFWAISTQESGGNYGAVGPSVQGGHHAYGKYQVMDYNIPSWTRKHYGRSLTASQFLNNPKAQEAVARGMLQGYYNKYGPRGAASMWYSGQPNPNKTYGNPPVYKYVNSVMGHASRYKGGGSSASQASATYKEAEKKQLARNEQAELYGFVEALLDSNRELKSLFSKAVKGQWTADKFQAELRDTKWFKTHSESERKFLTTKYGDPRTAKQQLDQAYVKVRQMAGQLGLVESASLLKKMNTWAYNVVAKGWDEGMLRNEIGKYVYFDKHLQGEGGEVQMKLKDLAYNMGVTMAGSWYADKTRNVIRGLATVQDYEDEIRKKAAALYPQFKKQIDSGQTVMDIASPYIQSMQNILEIPAGSVSIQDKVIKSALTTKSKATGKVEVMPLWQFENQLRSDPRWKQTTNAQNGMMQVAHQVLTDFGVTY